MPTPKIIIHNFFVYFSAAQRELDAMTSSMVVLDKERQSAIFLATTEKILRYFDKIL